MRRSFQQEVQQRADREKEKRTGLSLSTTGTTSSSSWQQSQPYRTANSQNGTVVSDSVAAPDVQVLNPAHVPCVDCCYHRRVQFAQ